MPNWQDYPNFTAAEFRCKHTGRDGMDKEFMGRLQALRTAYGRPMVINSGYRHHTHPVEAAKGHRNGEHVQGRCADVHATSSGDRFRLVRLALEHGFTRIGIAATFVHIGLGTGDLPEQVIWLY